jgi:metal-responsive CopG/Arc/MetJ family transcriptional regulator
MTEPRKNITVRLRPSAVEEIDEIAKTEQRTRGDMIRILLADGIKQYRRKRAS